MASFYSYLPLLQQVEAGFQKLAKDHGNYNSLGELVGTNYGISARFYETVIGRPPSEQDMRNITKSQAEQIFLDYFWNAENASQINSQAVANTIIDHQINAGNGVQIAQQVLNNSFGFNLDDDNVLGKNTLAALNSVDPAKFVTRYNDARAYFYTHNSSSSVFASVWLNRLKKFAVTYREPLSIITIVTIATVGFILYHNVLKN